MKTVFVLGVAFLLISCSEILEVEDISSRTVYVLAPTEGSIVNSSDINFSWDSVEEAEQYRLQVATPSFEMATQIVLDTLISETSFNHTLYPDYFEWRVRAENSGYQTNYTSQNFTIEE